MVAMTEGDMIVGALATDVECVRGSPASFVAICRGEEHNALSANEGETVGG